MKASTSPHPVETIFGTGLRRLLAWGVPLSAAALAFGAPEPDNGLWAYSVIHLTVLQLATLLFVMETARLTDVPWFQDVRFPWLASAASLIAAAVGFSALLTLATSAAARYDASLQFLQLLSSVDIAWVVSALYIGARTLAGIRLAVPAGLALIAGCIWSISAYLSEVGFAAAGGWLVDGGQLLRIVLPADAAAAVVSLAVLLGAARRADQPTLQERLQS